MIVICFLARFAGQPRAGGKKGTSVRKRIVTSKETDREKGYNGDKDGKATSVGTLSLGRKSRRRPG